MEKIKITHAIIRNGISRGITEGTKVPEKSSFTCIECTKMGCSLKKCNKAYEEDFWDASVEWEDQEAVLNKLPPSALKGIIRVIDGIYPLLGVNAEKVWQSQIMGFKGWQDCGIDPIHMDTSQEYRRVLRIN